jgi:hypothetical protein
VKDVPGPRGRAHRRARAGGKHRELRFRNLCVDPYRLQAIHAKERRARHEGCPFANRQLRHDAIRGCNDRGGRTRLPLTLQRQNGGLRHTEHEKALASRIANRLAALGSRLQQRQIFFLRGQPLRRENVSERLTATNDLQRRLHMQSRDVALDTSLHDFEQMLIERDAPDCSELRSQYGLLDFRESHAEVLRHG